MIVIMIISQLKFNIIITIMSEVTAEDILKH